MPKTWTNDYGDLPWWYRGPAFRGLTVHLPSERRARAAMAAFYGLVGEL